MTQNMFTKEDRDIVKSIVDGRGGLDLLIRDDEVISKRKAEIIKELRAALANSSQDSSLMRSMVLLETYLSDVMISELKKYKDRRDRYRERVEEEMQAVWDGATD